MNADSTNVIPSDLVGEWGYYAGINPSVCIKINADGSGNIMTLSDGKWFVNGNTIEFRKVGDNNFPIASSVQYSIINGKLLFSEPIQGDLINDFIQLMPPYRPTGLDKIKR